MAHVQVAASAFSGLSITGRVYLVEVAMAAVPSGAFLFQYVKVSPLDRPHLPFTCPSRSSRC